LFDPKGPIGEAQRFVIIAAIALMAIVVIPVFIMAFWFPRKYRASNTESTYMPKWSHSAKIDFFMWAVPIAIVTVLAILAWTSTHSLDPYKPIPSAEKPINIEAVSQDWKWLFIYPDQNIATVNKSFSLQVPLSSNHLDTVAFFIRSWRGYIRACKPLHRKLINRAFMKATTSKRGAVALHAFKAHRCPVKSFKWVQRSDKLRKSLI
jgi:hypothetical protein